MRPRRAGGILLMLCLSSSMLRAQTAAPPAATLFRVFLKDGTSLVSYGEVARVGDRVIFSMPISPSGDDPELQLVNLPDNKIDWDHTNRYAESARSGLYLKTGAEIDYAQVSNEVAQALNTASGTPDPLKRLDIVERARKTLADWPAAHYHYREAEIRQLLAVLDESIADLRAAAGTTRFDLSLVTIGDVTPPGETLLPTPTQQEAIEGMLAAANATDSAADRTALLTAAVAGIQKHSDALPRDWSAMMSAAATASIAREHETDRAYQALTAGALDQARSRAKSADVRGLQRLMDDIRARDASLGAKRPESVGALLDSVALQLDAARRLQLVRDKWELRVPEYRKYRAQILVSLNRFAEMKTALESIKALAGSSPFVLNDLERTDGVIRKNIAATTPPDELKETHSLLASAVELADSAVRIRREAALTASIVRAWDASAAAAGALMLVDRARTELTAALQMPQLNQDAQQPQ